MTDLVKWDKAMREVEEELQRLPLQQQRRCRISQLERRLDMIDTQIDSIVQRTKER